MGRRTRDAEAELNLPPGFRFHPTDEELVAHYLCHKAAQQHLPVSIIAEVDLYKYDPWQLPDLALFGSREWYFFTPRDRKYPNGSRPNRAAASGYWKATGADKPITPAGSARPLGIKKALVFYAGKAPKGVKTDWIMHEYRLVGTSRAANKKGGGGSNLRLDDWVLCRLYNKKNNWGKMQQRQTEAASVGDTMDSLEATDDTASGSLKTPESDVDDDMYAEHDGPSNPLLYAPPQAITTAQAPGTGATAAGVQLPDRVKEEEWFMDLNLDDLQSSLMAFVGAAPPMDLSCQDYPFFGLSSPQMKPNRLPNLPTFSDLKM